MHETTASKRTPLYNLHSAAGATFTGFAGWQMPLRYAAGTLNEHHHTRTRAGLFDISHMGQIELAGSQRAAALETLTPTDVVSLPPGQQRYALLTNAEGGIIDDMVIANTGDSLILVVNAARYAVVLAHLSVALANTCSVKPLEATALLALQGPEAAATLASVAPEAATLSFQGVTNMSLAGIDCRVSRSGYTGEDGFEIALPADRANDLAQHLLAVDAVNLIGLGARDSLRLEAGLCLYGHDINETTSVLTAGLGWTWPAVRRAGGARAGGFPGADCQEVERLQGPSLRRVGLLPEGRAPLREGAELLDADGIRVGHVTSGLHSPTLQKPIAMGYIRNDSTMPLQSMLRGRPVPVQVTALPFVPHRYYRG